MADYDLKTDLQNQHERNNAESDDFVQLDPDTLLVAEPTFIYEDDREEAEEDLYPIPSSTHMHVSGFNSTDRPLGTFDDIPSYSHHDEFLPEPEEEHPLPDSTERAPTPEIAASNRPLIDYDDLLTYKEVYQPPPPSAPPAEPEQSKMSTFSEGGWIDLKNLDPRVVELIYWRDVKKTGVVFGSVLIILLSLSYFSLLSVLAYLSLAVLCVTFTFRLYKNVLQVVQKSNDGHPFKPYLEKDLTIPEDKVQQAIEVLIKHVNCVIHELRRLFLVEDLVASVKFGILLWVLTYIGAWFNGMTLVILAFVALFTLPKVYETYKTQIDHYLLLAQTQINNVIQQIKAKVPVGKKEKTQ